MVRYNSFASAGRVSWGRYGILYQYRRHLAVAGVGVSLFYAMNLEKVPVSGRYRFMIVSPRLELRIGQYTYNQMLARFRGAILPDFSPQTQRVKRVMDRLIKVSGLPAGINWKVHVIAGMRNPPNAFVLPGGKVFVFESMLPICQDDNGLATVLSHEVAHQVCRHSAEQMSRAPLTFAANIAMFLITGYSSFDNLLLKVAVELPSSRSNEKEADYVGLMMMARACYNPESAAMFWMRMLQMERSQGGDRVPEMLSTHPASERRVTDIRRYLPEAENVRADTCGMADKFWDVSRW